MREEAGAARVREEDEGGCQEYNNILARRKLKHGKTDPHERGGKSGEKLKGTTLSTLYSR